MTFVVLKTLDNLVSMRNSLNANNCCRKQNFDTVHLNLSFISNVLSELIQLLPLKSLVFVVHFLNDFGMETRDFQKVVLRMKLFLSLQSFFFHIVK